MHTGEVGIEIEPVLDGAAVDALLADRIDALLRRTCKIARVCGADGHTYGLLQLSDKSGDRDFDGADEENIRELTSLIGETLDALSSAANGTN